MSTPNAPATPLDGIHHITAITGDAPANVEFYVGVLGLRLVKQSVNQDEPTVYHLFYGDDEARPGADLTFFEYPGATRGRPGAGMIHRILWRVASSGAFDYWANRLAGFGVGSEGTADGLLFSDPDGLEHELLVADVADEPLPATGAGVDPAHALLGFEGVRAYRTSSPQAEQLLEGTLGFTPIGDGAYQVSGPARHGRYITDPPPAEPGRQSAGSVHHVAFAMELDEAEAWRAHVAASSAHPTPIIERFYFRSVYFREPGGILFELATKGPGFTADEPLESLGEHLSLPPRLEPRREEITPALTPLPDAAALYAGERRAHLRR